MPRVTAAVGTGWRGLVSAAVALGLVVAIGLLMRSLSVVPPGLLGELVVWLPMLGAVAVGAGPWAGIRDRLGLRALPIDILWGVAAGLLARAADALIRFATTGTTGLQQQPAPTLAGSVALALVVTVIVAPLIEELFFRGLLQGAIVGLLRGGTASTAATSAGVLLASIVFALVHLLGGAAPPAVLGVLAFGLISGSLAAATGRIGGAVIAHVTFNGLAVAVAWPW